MQENVGNEDHARTRPEKEMPPVNEHSPRRRFVYSETERGFSEALIIMRIRYIPRDSFGLDVSLFNN